jgi:N-acetylmuramoyl-L-alanine amidase
MAGRSLASVASSTKAKYARHKSDCRSTIMIDAQHTSIAWLMALGLAASIAGPAARAEQPAPPATETSAPAPSNCRRADFRVVIDVGHTINVPGALSARGTPEYDFNLKLGQQVEAALHDSGFANAVLMITDKPPTRGLFERAARANAMRADLFIAIHHDSVPDNLLQSWDFHGQQSSYNDDFPGYAIFISNGNADPAGSLQFGRFLGTELQARGLHYTPHYTLALMGHRRRQLVDARAGVYRYDQLVVLNATRMPAVLLEAGSIINRDEELELAKPERRALTSAAITAAVDEFCAARSSPRVAHVLKRPRAGEAKAEPGR